MHRKSYINFNQFNTNINKKKLVLRKNKKKCILYIYFKINDYVFQRFPHIFPFFLIQHIKLQILNINNNNSFELLILMCNFILNCTLELHQKRPLNKYLKISTYI